MHRLVFLCFFGLILVKYATAQLLEINLAINYGKIGNITHAICDHRLEDVHKYTALEGKSLTINLNLNLKTFINRFRCTQYNNSTMVFLNNNSPLRNVTTLTVKREMGAIWDCEIWTHWGVRYMEPTVNDDGHTYAAPHCYLRLHVRRTEAPQTILVNNVISQPVRTDLSEQHVDFRLEYEYADNDMVDITCSNYNYDALGTAELSLEHSKLTETKLAPLSSPASVGVRVRLHSRHDRASITCNYTENDDFTNIQVVFILQTNFDCAVNVSIDGLNLRPKLVNDFCVIDYNFVSKETIDMQCEVNPQVNLIVSPENEFKRNNTIRNLAEATFVLNQEKHDVKCSADDVTNGKFTGPTIINFNPLVKLMTDKCPLHVELPQNNIVKELHEWRNSSRIYYEYEEGDNVTISCHTTCDTTPVQVKMKRGGKLSDIKPNPDNTEKNCTTTLSMTGQSYQTDQTKLSCFLDEKRMGNKKPVRKRMATVIFLRKANTTTISTTTISTPTPETTTEGSTPGGESIDTSQGIPNWVWTVAGIVTGFLVLFIFTLVYKMNKRNVPQRGREFSNHQFSTQLENNYAVPMDHRQDNVTYSEPYRPVEDLYTVPIPKNERKKTIDPTYATLDLHNNGRKKNNFIPTDDPNYAEVNNEANHAKIQRNAFKITDDPHYAEISKNVGENYAKVLPKSKRNVPYNHYAHMHNDTYSNIGERSVEPTYCEPTLQKGYYENVVNHGHYVNKTGDVDYVEPTYCEANTKTK